MQIRLGMSGNSVRSVQQRLLDLKLLTGAADGDFGGGTEGAVKTFQKEQGLAITGVVDAETWSKLLPGEPAPATVLAHQPLVKKCLSLTGSFETGKQPPECFCALAGDFDGEGISFGVLQWNLGQGTLQEMLKETFEQHPPVCQAIFHEHFDTVLALGTAPREQQLEFSRSIQIRGTVVEPWQGMLKALGRTPEFQDVQVSHAKEKFDSALTACQEFSLKSERAVALLFDIITQNGGIGPIVKAQILSDYATIPDGDPDQMEVAKMRVVATRRAAAARPQFAGDVRTRKLTIAEGIGTVHGIFYDLEDMFGITLNAPVM